MPMFTATRAMIKPRRLRSSMKRVVIMPHVGIHEPRWSLSAGARMGVGAGPGCRCADVGDRRHSEAPNRLVTERNHCSSEA